MLTYFTKLHSASVHVFGGVDKDIFNQTDLHQKIPIYLNHSSPHQEHNSSDETVIGKKDTITDQSSLADIAAGHKMSTS